MILLFWFKRLSVRARSQLISDLFSLSQAGYVDATLPLSLIKYMYQEDDYLPWNTLINNRISFYINMLESTELYGEFKSYLSSLMLQYYQKIGWVEDKDKEEPVDGFIRSSVVQLACYIGVPECIRTAQSYFNEWMNSPSINLIPPELKSIAYCVGVSKSEHAFEFLTAQLKKEKKENVKVDLLVGLSCALNTWQLEKFLSDRLETSNDTIEALRYIITKSPASSTHMFAWSFVKNRWKELYARYGQPDLNSPNQIYIKDVLNDLASKFNTPAFYNDVFIKSKVNFFDIY